MPHPTSTPRAASSNATTDRIGRRAVLASLAVATGGIAGCADETPSGTVEEDGSVWSTSIEADIGTVAETVFEPTGHHTAIAFDVGFGPDGEGGRTDVLAVDVEETAETVEFTLRDDLAWSNGDTLTPDGFGQWLTMLRAGSASFHPVPAIRGDELAPRTPIEAITDVEWDDRSIRIQGRFESTESPRRFVNTYLGSRPERYYERLWERVQDEYDEEPWESETALENVRGIVAGNLWGTPDDWLPEDGIRLAGHPDEPGEEAAYSGLWYPYRIRNRQLRFRRNEHHPFADRVELDELSVTVRNEPPAIFSDLRTGSIDAAERSDFSREVHDELPETMASIRGRPHRIIALEFNHDLDPFADRDVRAALAHAIDRTGVANSLESFSTEPIAVPGGDLHREEWFSAEFEASLRTYEYDLERAAELLRRAGWTREDGEWYTPTGETPSLTVLTDDPDPTLVATLRSHLEAFGFESGYRGLESTTYHRRLEHGIFEANTTTRETPIADGWPRARGGEYVDPIHHGDGFRDSAYLGRELEAAVAGESGLRWQDGTEDAPLRDRRFVYDSLSDLRAVTVQAPPIGEPNGEPEEWPYLYHAARARAAKTAEEAADHARACTWIYNYQLPLIELTVDVPRIVHETDGWSIPDSDSSWWQHVGGATQPGGLWAPLAYGAIDRDTGTETEP